MKQSYTALLVLAAQGGDKQAFNQLCELHYQASYRFAYKLCQPRSSVLYAQAILQALQSKLWGYTVYFG